MKIIKNILNTVEGLSNIKLTEKDLIPAYYPITTVLLAIAHHKEEKINTQQIASLFSLFGRLLELQKSAIDGNKDAQTLYSGIEKLANPPKMLRTDKKALFVPRVEDLLNACGSSPHLVRAYEFRLLMSNLSFLVEPVCNCSESKTIRKSTIEINGNSLESTGNADEIFHSIVNSLSTTCNCYKLRPQSKIKLRTKLIARNKDLVKEVVDFFDGASKSVLRRITLEGLARKIYLNRKNSKDNDAKYTEREINRDIKYLRDFENQYPNKIDNSDSLPVWDGDCLPYQILDVFEKGKS